MVVQLILERGRDPGVCVTGLSPCGAGEHAHVLLCHPIPEVLSQRELPWRGAASHPVGRMPGIPAGWRLFLSKAQLGQDPGQFPGSEWELPHSHGCLAERSASYLSLPAPPRPAPDDASAGRFLANPASSAHENWSQLMWGKRRETLMGGRDPSVSQTGQPPRWGSAAPSLSPSCCLRRHCPAVGRGGGGAVVFLDSRPSQGRSSPRRGPVPSSTDEVPSEGPVPDGLCRGGQAE